MEPDCVVIIPARLASSRFPGKVLAPLAGRPLITHVIDRVRAARSSSRLIVATDDRRIAAVVEAHAAEAWLTDPSHPSGTDRIAEVARELECQLVVNVQGDEPMLPPSAIDRCVEALAEDPGAGLSTLAHAVDVDRAQDPNVVKVVRDRRGRALYFSRAPIPRLRPGEAGSLLRHIGIYGYRRDVLLRLADLEPTPLERHERLEQLRALEHGIAIQVGLVDWAVQGVDTPADLERVEALLAAATSPGETQGGR
ncbi:MAG: 3-deoxy-manno-octulosonate cytidylyltransferase [Candidatus Eiseniibacteriota bacterium]